MAIDILKGALYGMFRMCNKYVLLKLLHGLKIKTALDARVD